MRPSSERSHPRRSKRGQGWYKAVERIAPSLHQRRNYGANHLFYRSVRQLSNPGLELHCLVDWHMALRAALGAMFLLAPSAHWAKRRTKLVRMVPESLGNTGIWVSVTGFAEIAIAAGLQIPRVKLWVAGIAVIMLCCLFPANVRAAREHLTISQKPGMQVAPCLILQNFFIAALIRSVWPGR